MELSRFSVTFLVSLVFGIWVLWTIPKQIRTGVIFIRRFPFPWEQIVRREHPYLFIIFIFVQLLMGISLIVGGVVGEVLLFLV
jgi:hypothetical protein